MAKSWVLYIISLRCIFDQTEIPFKVIENAKRNSKLELVTFKCDLDFGEGGGKRLGDIVEWWVLHIISLRRTFDQSLMKVLPKVVQIWSVHEIQDSNT